jgi:hypothetical protein
MVTGKFHHFGVPTKTKNENETYIDAGGVYVTDPDQHPYRVEFLRFDGDSCMPKELQTTPHAAYMVDSLEEALKGQEVFIEPFDATDTLRVAFIKDGEALIEVMQEK